MEDKKVILISSGQPSTNPRLVKEAISLYNEGVNVTILYSYWASWADKPDDDLRNEYPNITWKRVGGHPKEEKWKYFFSRFGNKLSKILYNLTSLNLFSINSLSRTSLSLIKNAKSMKADLYIAHNLGALPAAIKAAQKYKAFVSIDFEDYYRGQWAARSREYRLCKKIEDRYLPYISFTTAASPLIAKKYKEDYSFLSPVVINNVFSKKYLQKFCQPYQKNNVLKLFWFSQTVGKGRGLEQIIKAMGNLNNNKVSITILGSSNKAIKTHLLQIARSVGVAENQIDFIDPVPLEKIFSIAAEHHIGLALESEPTINREICLTNKVFTYLLSGLAIVATNTLAQIQFLETYDGVGKYFDKQNDIDLAELINQYRLSPELLQFHRENALCLAEQKLNWEKEEVLFLDLVKEYLLKIKFKKVLIISPNFPPVNSADMHRVRQSLPFFKKLGWQAEVMAVDPKYAEAYSEDKLLLQTIPGYIKVHYVKAWNVNTTRKFGLGSLSIRSFFYFKKKGNKLLKEEKFDLIYFSTTAFHVMALGPYWKKKYKVPFILDIQDPWSNDFYLDKPASERPPKFFINYHIDKLLESFTVPKADGIISVSKGYIDNFLQRYKNLNKERLKVITFAGSTIDFEIMNKNIHSFNSIEFDKTKLNIVYIGRGGYDLQRACKIFFNAIRQGLDEGIENFSKLHLWFIGTSYAVPGQGTQTIYPIASECNISHHVTEITDRVSYFESLYLLSCANILFVPGSIDNNYTASKIFPYILTQKPLVAIFNSSSSVVDILQKCNYGDIVYLDNKDDTLLSNKCKDILSNMLSPVYKPVFYSAEKFNEFSSEKLTERQVDLFNQVVKPEYNSTSLVRNSYVYVKIPNTGLGNKMLVWARAFVFSHLNSIPLITSSWTHIAWGAILRNERKKRWYGGYFQQGNFLFRSVFHLRQYILARVTEPPVKEIMLEPSTVYEFSKMFTRRDLFYEIRPYRDLIIYALFNLLQPRLQKKVHLLETPFIGIHIRRGDFKMGSIITPLSFFSDSIQWIRSIINYDCPVTIYTDASSKEIESILRLGNVHLSKPKEDILDIIELSRSKILITSAGSTFSYWAAFLGESIVLKPPIEWHAPLRPTEYNDTKFEGIIDTKNTFEGKEDLISLLRRL